jgi:hypothetical protein
MVGMWTYGELANFDVVDTGSFLLFSGTESERGYKSAHEVESSEDKAGSEERVGAASEGICELVAELDPVAVEPAAGDDSVAIEMRNVVTAWRLVTRDLRMISYRTYAAKNAVRMFPMKPPTP